MTELSKEYLAQMRSWHEDQDHYLYCHHEVGQLLSHIANLTARLEQAERNDRRYQYLRREHVDFVVQQTYPKIWKACHGPEMDDAIDCAIERAALSSKEGV